MNRPVYSYKYIALKYNKKTDEYYVYDVSDTENLISEETDVALEWNYMTNKYMAYGQSRAAKLIEYYNNQRNTKTEIEDEIEELLTECYYNGCVLEINERHPGRKFEIYKEHKKDNSLELIAIGTRLIHLLRFASSLGWKTGKTTK